MSSLYGYCMAIPLPLVFGEAAQFAPAAVSDFGTGCSISTGQRPEWTSPEAGPSVLSWLRIDNQLVGRLPIRTMRIKWGRPPGLSGWACGPPIVMKTKFEGGQSCPQPAFSRLLAALQFSITCRGFSTVRGSSRTRSSRNGISHIQKRTGRRGRRPQDWSPAPRA